MASLFTDIRLALRTLRRNPLFEVVAISSLALGIGANTAIFTLLDQMALRKLPVRAPDNLVMLYQEGANMGSNAGSRMHSYPLYQDLQQKAEPLAEVLCRRLTPVSLSVDQQTERVEAELVSGNYFTMLGVQPALGRVFSSSQDDQVYRGHPVVVLSYGYWARRFARDPAVIGKTIRVNDYAMTIVGVSAEGFTGLDPTRSPQLRVPMAMKPIMLPELSWAHMDDRRSRWVQVFARLKPGYTVASARAPLQKFFLDERTYEMTLPAARQWSAYSRDQFMHGQLIATGAAMGYSPLRNDLSVALVVLMTMVGLVLLIACANVANLLIARGFMRQKEIALRLSLGASRGRIVSQLLVESLVLATAGGVLGLGVASGLTHTLLAFAPGGGASLLISAAPDGRILAFALLVTTATGVLFGLVPAVRVSRPDLWNTLKTTMGSIAGGGGSVLLRKGLVTAQVAFSFVLLFGAGLFVRSLDNLKTADTGLGLENLLMFQVSPALNGYTAARATAFKHDVLARLRAAPGISAAGMASVALLAGGEWDNSMAVEGYQSHDGEDMQAFMNAVSPGYFDTMRIPLIAGRDFRDSDIVDGPSPRVAIVNRQFAEHFFPGGRALGKRLGQGAAPDTKLTIEIIGVVADSLYEGPREGIHRQVFVPHQGNTTAAIYVRATAGSAGLYDLIRQQVRQLDPAMPVYNLKTVQGQLDETLASDRVVALLSAGFGLLATLLASIGLYGVMAFVVARRRKELGIRLALGARPGLMMWLVMREVLVLFVLGIGIGVPAGLGLGRYVATQLYGIQGHDPAIATGTVVLLAFVSAIAGLIPARRAARIDPILALRYE